MTQLISEADCTRCRIIEDGDQLFQVIKNVNDELFFVLDFSSDVNAHHRSIKWMTDDMMQPLDQYGDALWLSALIKIKEDHYYFYHRCHHAVLDGFGGNLIAQRIAEIYTALEQKRDTAPNPYGSMKDLINNEMEYKSSSRYKKDRQYWLDNLTNLPDPISLSQKITPSSVGLKRKHFTLPKEVINKLHLMGKQIGVSLPQTLTTLVCAYFYRMTGADDLVFAMPVTGRVSRIQRNIPGMMANAVVIRLAMNSEISFIQLAKQVSSVVTKALRHQQYRYEDLRKDLDLMSSGKQIASLGVNIEPFDYDLKFGQCAASIHNLSNAHIDDLTVFMFDRHNHDGLIVEFDANPNRYSDEDLENHIQQFNRMIEGMINKPEHPISKIDLLSEHERQLILSTWNNTEKPIPYLTIVDLFDAQVIRSPWATAVITEQLSLTYSELNRLANNWANELISQGVKTGDLIAIALTRNTNMLVGLLATLKAGAAYLPLDPDFPEERLRSILDDAKPKLILSCQEAIKQLPKTKITTLLLDQAEFNETHRGLHPKNIRIGEKSPAYIIYTSGSTGRPKGVEIPHSALTNFLSAMQQELKLSESDRFLAVTTISFDISILELFLPLVIGASVIIADRHIIRNPQALTQFATTNGTTIMQATPSLWQALLPTYSEELHGIKALVGGEALPGKLAQMISKLGRQAINLYGPTETTIWSSIMQLENKHDINHPPIGRPIANTQIYVLNQALEAVPAGVSGDLYIGGNGLALGYYKRPDLTNERFIANPFSQEKNRLYKTGDKAKWRRDGILEYQGRDDFQVKIQGYRIEIGDIESSLLRYREVTQAIVAAQTSPNQSKQLVAYIVPVDTNLDTNKLRRRLIQCLPDYMVPNHFIIMDEIPLTPNGKVNRKALPMPIWQATNTYMAPRNQIETSLAALWAKTLGLQQVGIHDNFFAIGGDSISATSIINQIKNTMQIDIPLGVLFKTSTIAELAEYLNQDDSWDPLTTLLAIESSGDNTPLFCFHPALGLSWSYAGLLKYLPNSTPLYGLQASGLSSLARLPESIEEMARDYIKQIQLIQPHGPYRLLGWSFGGLVSHSVAEKLQAAGEKIDLLCMLDSYPYQLDYQEPKNEAETVKAALLFLGYDLSALEKLPINKNELAALLWRDYDEPSMAVVQDMKKKQANIMEHIQIVIENNLSLASRFLPGKVHSDLLFFVAEESLNSSMGNILEHKTEAWKSRIEGKMTVHNIPCLHQDMLDANTLNTIGPILAEYLNTSKIKQPS